MERIGPPQPEEVNKKPKKTSRMRSKRGPRAPLEPLFMPDGIMFVPPEMVPVKETPGEDD